MLQLRLYIVRHLAPPSPSTVLSRPLEPFSSEMTYAANLSPLPQHPPRSTSHKLCLTSTLSTILLPTHLLGPTRLTQTHRQMHHHASIISAMPMRRPRPTHNQIAHTYPSWLLALVADPARAGFDFEDLATFVRVPEGATSGAECDVGGHDAVGFAGGFDGVLGKLVGRLMDGRRRTLGFRKGKRCGS